MFNSNRNEAAMRSMFPAVKRDPNLLLLKSPISSSLRQSRYQSVSAVVVNRIFTKIWCSDTPPPTPKKTAEQKQRGIVWFPHRASKQVLLICGLRKISGRTSDVKVSHFAEGETNSYYSLCHRGKKLRAILCMCIMEGGCWRHPELKTAPRGPARWFTDSNSRHLGVLSLSSQHPWWL